MPTKAIFLLTLALPASLAGAEPLVASFKRDIQPLLDSHCYDCHGMGNRKGGVSLEDFESDAALRDTGLWMRVLKNVRAGIMPPADEERLTPADTEKLATWIKRDAFGLDPAKPDPGRVTVRRLNRVEYRNTIRDLIGVDFDTQKEFPPDDTGQGFDNLGDVLTLSPMLLERYLDAAQAIVGRAVPTEPLVPAEYTLPGNAFASAVPAGNNREGETSVYKRPPPKIVGKNLDLSYYTPVTVSSSYHAKAAGAYQISVNLKAVESYVDDQFDLNRCRLLFQVDGETLIDQEFVREGEKSFDFTFDRSWSTGEHVVVFQLQPAGPDREQKRQLRLRLTGVTVKGPLAPEHWVPPANYGRFFPKPAPRDKGDRHRYAAELLQTFATRAYRRPVDGPTLERLATMADSVSSQPGNTFEAGVAQAMVAVLASPRFLFREESTEPLQDGQTHPFVDEYALASRLSYFFWSTMPDAELFQLAGKGSLRKNLNQQVARLLSDPKAGEFVRNFTGQWLQARDIANVQVNPVAVHFREHPDPVAEESIATFRRLNRIPEEKRTPAEAELHKASRAVYLANIRQPRPQLSGELREAMRQESERVFSYILKENRSLVELIESDYTFLNETLAKHYDIPGVTGAEMRKVTLPPGSPRGGVLTQGTVLAVTSNPTRTSPVKRGVFILDSILGTRPPAPPPNIPALEDAASPEKIKTLTLRENLALHATNKMCSSCHSRMDPLGLALENFNALGKWRDAELNQTIDPAGVLITGEKFKDIRELKHILATTHRRDFYYCLSQKLLTYALGRALDYYDTETLDRLVSELETSGGRPSALLYGIVNSAPFQQRRAQEPAMPASVASASLTSTPATH